MSLSWWFYFIDVAGNFQGLLIGLSIFFAVGTVGTLLVTLEHHPSYWGDEKWKAWWRTLKFFIFPTPVILLLLIATPSEKTLYLMLGANTAQEIVNNPTVKETGGKLLKLIDQKLEELTVEKKEKK